ncbi:hypothetical protein FACS189442_2850 [Spirochaetia bacterium]|nr:hypothetical protein FACS189442_2850 [Spirochaetia bacterium]
MLAVKGIYDGKVVVPKEAVPFKENYDVVITFLEPSSKQIPESPVDLDKQQRIQEKRVILESLAGLVPSDVDENAIKMERLAMAESLFGILPSSIGDDEIRTERLKRYEHNT